MRKRSADECRSRWKDYLEPGGQEKGGREEEILSLHELFPHQWESIGEILGKRGHFCRKRYLEIMRMEEKEGFIQAAEDVADVDHKERNEIEKMVEEAEKRLRKARKGSNGLIKQNRKILNEDKLAK